MKLIIVLGYLGSGKTTFMTKYLEKIKNQYNGVIVNDFGDSDVDGVVLEDFAPQTVFGGSMFCSCKSDTFVKVATEMAKKPFDNLVVEASGFANPFNLTELIELVNRNAENKLELGGVVTVVDSTNVEKILATLKMTKMQIAFADLVLINKVDLVSSSHLIRVKELVREINPNARIEETIGSEPNDYEIKAVEKTLPINIKDIVMQKMQMSVPKDVTKETLDAICTELELVVQRIKGTVVIDGENFVYQYINSVGTLIASKKTSQNKIVLLSASGKFKKQVREVLTNYSQFKIIE